MDFSQFHGSDHWPGSPYCWTQHGGLWTHLKYGWEYRWRDLIGCKIGRHRYVTWFKATGEEVTPRKCRGCLREERDG